MQTMEQALADLTLRRIVNADEAFSHTNRRDILAGILERSGLDVRGVLASLELNAPPPQAAAGGLRVAGSPA
ncbi:MAG: hypothetical protein E6F98_16290 [Actinobacteria bacterium]|nr:MAG: hypothetical protein E6F98_16290 [Actinomycetota bacterium]